MGGPIEIIQLGKRARFEIAWEKQVRGLAQIGIVE
jgi:hypothetical protein